MSMQLTLILITSFNLQESITATTMMWEMDWNKFGHSNPEISPLFLMTESQILIYLPLEKNNLHSKILK